MPLAFLLINITGNGAWTGDALSVVRAYLKNRNAANALRMLSITYLGCAVGTGLVAVLAAAGQLACCTPIVAIATNKIGLGLLGFADQLAVGSYMQARSDLSSKSHNIRQGNQYTVSHLCLCHDWLRGTACQACSSFKQLWRVE